jgi:TPR repeat protein
MRRDRGVLGQSASQMLVTANTEASADGGVQPGGDIFDSLDMLAAAPRATVLADAKPAAETVALASQGDERALLSCADFYKQSGDLDNAVHYLKMGSAWGHKEVLFKLARLHWDAPAESCWRKREEALRLFTSAATEGHVGAAYMVGVAHTTGQGGKLCCIPINAVLSPCPVSVQQRLPRRMAGADKSEKEARRWLQEAAEGGHMEARYNLGVSLLNGGGGGTKAGARDWEEGARLLEQAGGQGHPLAQNSIGVAYLKGWGVEPDIAKAIHWFELSAEQAQLDSITNLGAIHLHGHGVPADAEKAVKYFEMAAGLGDGQACFNLGVHMCQTVQEEMVELSEMSQRGQMSQRGGEAEAEAGGGAGAGGGSATAGAAVEAVVEAALCGAKAWFAQALDRGVERARERLADVDMRLAFFASLDGCGSGGGGGDDGGAAAVAAAPRSAAAGGGAGRRNSRAKAAALLAERKQQL